MVSSFRNVETTIIEKTKDGEYLCDVYSRLLKDRILFLKEEISSEVATTLAAHMLLLDAKDSKKPVIIYINSPGGTVSDGLSTIYDTIQFIRSPVKTICIGAAFSGAAVILAAGTKSQRYAFPNSKIMIHGLQIDGLSGTANDIAIKSAEVNSINAKIAEMISKHSGKPLEVVVEDLKADKYMTAEEALAYGLIDEIVPATKVVPAQPTKTKIISAKPARAKK